MAFEIKRNRSRIFVHKIMFIGELLFIRDKLFNIHNYHVWTNDNPYNMMPRNF